MKSSLMLIGAVAHGADVNVQTVRYYERQGLLPKPRRTPGGYREYGPDSVSVVRFVKRAQQLGFSLAEIGDLLDLRANQEASCAEIRAAARDKVADINRRVEALLAMTRALDVLIRSCRSEASIRECPILEALNQNLEIEGEPKRKGERNAKEKP